MAKSDDKEEKEKDSEEETEQKKPREAEHDEDASAQVTSKPTAEELLHSELPKVSEEEGAEGHDGYSFDSEKEEAGNEYTLNDLASEEPTSSGVEPSRPRSFMMDQDEPTNLNQHIPSSGVYVGGRKKGGKKKTLMLLVIALLVIGGLVYLLKGRLLGGSSGGESPTPSPTIAQDTPTPTPTLLAVDRSKYTVDVLNGSGKTGLAASVSAKLKDLGYKIGNTGNATNSAFTQTQVVAKPSVASFLIDQLIKDLSPDFNAASSSSSLKESNASDVQVILGAK